MNEKFCKIEEEHDDGVKYFAGKIYESETEAWYAISDHLIESCGKESIGLYYHDLGNRIESRDGTESYTIISVNFDGEEK